MYLASLKLRFHPWYYLRQSSVFCDRCHIDHYTQQSCKVYFLNIWILHLSYYHQLVDNRTLVDWNYFWLDLCSSNKEEIKNHHHSSSSYYSICLVKNPIIQIQHFPIPIRCITMYLRPRYGWYNHQSRCTECLCIVISWNNVA